MKILNEISQEYLLKLLGLDNLPKKYLKTRIIWENILLVTKIFVILHPVWNRYQKQENKKFR